MFNRGSEWRKWDLHVHAPESIMYDGYSTKGVSKKDVWDKYCSLIENSDVRVFGITDYFSANSYYRFIEEFKSRYPKSKKVFFLNIELRINESVNSDLEEVNTHIIFNPQYINKVDKFLGRLNIIPTKTNEEKMSCAELVEQKDFQSATVSRDSIREAIKNTFGEKSIRQDHLLICTCANNDGLRPTRGIKRKEAISDEIDKFSDIFFGTSKNVDYFLNENRLEDNTQKIGKKAVISGSDAHSFSDLERRLGKTSTELGKNSKETDFYETTWIKSDPTFEGLKQVVFEPETGERVSIGPTKPDGKDSFRVIKSIEFNNSKAFPSKIEFNQNLSSIIGSRSSGKSALLAYIAHAVDASSTEEIKPDGPGAGYPWGEVDFEYSVKWNNDLKDSESKGQIIYIPQGYLYETSKRPDEIKEKIEPIIFKKIPKFKEFYETSMLGVNEENKKIRESVDNWFFVSDTISDNKNNLKKLGEKSSVEKEIADLESKIDNIRKSSKLTENEVQKFQNVKSKLTDINSQISNLERESLKIRSSSPDPKSYFSKLEITFSPSLSNLPDQLSSEINLAGRKVMKEMTEKVNKDIYRYYQSILDNQQKLAVEYENIKSENKELFAKYDKNKELQILIEKISLLKQSLGKINNIEKLLQDLGSKLKEVSISLSTLIQNRDLILSRLSSFLGGIDQSKFDIEFGIEFGFDYESLQILSQKFNMKYSSDFYDNSKNKLNLNSIRLKVNEFLTKMYSGEQKINLGHDLKSVAKDVTLFTEKVLFTASMEGDKIGGFNVSTMTPGKQALFALKLILEESDDTWPLLLDQPEDDLDSRSIYASIVPFLKSKKKERQIIMVSHNANLVIGSDSEQIIVANRNGKDRVNEDGKEFNYISGSIENTREKDTLFIDTLKSQGIREHACEILDGGKVAFENRRNKYNLSKI